MNNIIYKLHVQYIFQTVESTQSEIIVNLLIQIIKIP